MIICRFLLQPKGGDAFLVPCDGFLVREAKEVTQSSGDFQIGAAGQAGRPDRRQLLRGRTATPLGQSLPRSGFK